MIQIMGKTIHDPDRSFTSGRISLKGMKFHAFHGCFDFERECGGDYEVDFSAMQDSSHVQKGSVDLLAASCTDDLQDTLDYSRVYEIVARVMASPSNLIEKVAGDIMSAVLDEFPYLGEVEVTVRKMRPPIDGMDSGYAEYVLVSVL